MIKTTIPAAAVIGRPVARAAQAPRGDLRRNSPNAALPGKARATSAPMPASTKALRHAVTTTTRRAGSIRTLRVLAAIVRNRARIFARETIVAATSVRTPRAAIVRALIATTARHAAGIATAPREIAARPARRHVLPRRNSATSGPMRRVTVRSGPTRRVVNALTGNLATTRNSHAAATGGTATAHREIVALARSMIAAIQSRGRSATRVTTPAAIRVRNVKARGASTSHALTGPVTTGRARTAAMSARVFPPARGSSPGRALVS